MKLPKASQFRCETGDLTDFKIRETASAAALVAYLLAVDFEHPGTLAWVVRQVALADNNWQLKARSSNPDLSLACQRDAIAWMEEQDHLLVQRGVTKGAMQNAED